MELYGLLGRNIDYSFSRGYFSDKFTKEQLNCKYTNFDIPSIDQLPTVLQQEHLKGFNITIPYKEDIIPFLDHIDPIAKEIGAVNVVKVEENKTLTGYNTDYYGFSESLKPLLSNNVKKALILGTGGASKAIAYALKSLEILPTYISRTPTDGQLNYQDLTHAILKEHHLIINCTPLGTFPNIERCPDLPYRNLSSHHILYDLIYNPETTQFMKEGIQQGCKTSNGLKMLILQAEKSWELWN